MTLSESVAERVAGSRVGRAALSIVIVVLGIATIAWNLPPGSGPASTPGSSTLRHDLLVGGAPIMYALGLDQNWDVFAPPRMQVIGLEARIKYADGTRSVWRPPTSTGALFGAYRDYRWGKFVEYAIADANSSLWQPFAAWIARQHTSPGRRPVSVTLTRRFYNLYAITPGAPSHGPWKHFSYYTYRVPARSQ